MSHRADRCERPHGRRRDGRHGRVRACLASTSRISRSGEFPVPGRGSLDSVATSDECARGSRYGCSPRSARRCAAHTLSTFADLEERALGFAL